MFFALACPPSSTNFQGELCVAFRLVDTNWWAHFERALRVDRSELRIVSPFIKVGALNRLLPLGVERVRVITRYNLNDFASRASDIESLHTLLGHGAPVRGIRHLHAKFYVIGQSAAIVTSANLTSAGFASNHEFGVVVDDREAIATCCEKFEDLWRRGRCDLTHEEADAWTAELVRHRLAGGRVADSGTLSDYGADGGFVEPSPIGVPALFADAEHGFVKFHGARDHRAPPSTKTLDEVKASGCHRVVSYPDGRRPRGVEDGDVMFIARAYPGTCLEPHLRSRHCSEARARAGRCDSRRHRASPLEASMATLRASA